MQDHHQQQQLTEEQGLLGSLSPGQKKLEGKTFYLDSVKKRPTALLLETIALLGGRVESFLHKDVSFVVTGSQECPKDPKSTDIKTGAKGKSEEAQSPLMTRVLSSDKQRPGTPRPVACGSRGKALLEKAIRNNERLQRSSVLTNARSWGVKILYVDDVLLYLKQLTRECFSAAHKKPEKTNTKQGSHVVKAAALRSPYLKIEDASRKYKPLSMQSMTFPGLWYCGRFSPFECPPPLFEKRTDPGEKKTREPKKVEGSFQEKSLSCNPSPWRPRKKDLSYCECCQQPFTHLEEHLQSDQHRAFVLDLSNYTTVDQLMAEMSPGFDPDPPQQSDETQSRPPTPSLIQDVCELEPLTDVETERAVQALQGRGSSFDARISSPTRGPLSCGAASPSPAFPVPSPTTPPDIQPFTANMDCHHRASSPVMPVLDVEPQVHDTASQQLYIHHLSPCPDPPCSDPYSLPPVLSPQVPYPSCVTELHCLYSDPPVLSPQKCTAAQSVDESTCEMAAAVSVSTPRVALTNEGEKGSNQDAFPGFSGNADSTGCTTWSTCRSRSLPAATAPKPNKRRRSASNERGRRKRRRVTAERGHGGSWTEPGQKCAKPQSDIKAKPEGGVLFDEASLQIIQSCPIPEFPSAGSVELLGSKQTFTAFCVPTNQTDVLGQLSCLLSSRAKTSDWPHNEKPHSAFSSEDSQRSLSHSTSVCIESALIPDLATLSPSSDSNWDCEVLARLQPAPPASLLPAEHACELDKELLHRPCTWMHDTSYESRLHNALEPAASLCGDERDPSAFSRTVVQIVEVQH